MSHAKALHRDLMKALLTHLPQTIYADIPRMATLTWAVVTLCLTRTMRLSRNRRRSRDLRREPCPALCPLPPPASYRPSPLVSAAAQSCRAQLDAPNPLVCRPRYHCAGTVCLDPCLAGLSWASDPAGLEILADASAMVSFETYQPVVEQVRLLLPTSS